MRQRGCGEQTRPNYVHGKDAFDPLRSGLGQGKEGTRPGIVHQHVQAAMGLDGLGDGPHRVIGRGRVGDHGGDVAVTAGGFLEGRRTAAGDDDLRSRLGEAPRRGPADAGAAARDDDDFIFQRGHDAPGAGLKPVVAGAGHAARLRSLGCSLRKPMAMRFHRLIAPMAIEKRDEFFVGELTAHLLVDVVQRVTLRDRGRAYVQARTAHSHGV